MNNENLIDTDTDIAFDLTKKEIATTIALGIGFAAAMIGAREAYKRFVRKETPFADGSE